MQPQTLPGHGNRSSVLSSYACTGGPLRHGSYLYTFDILCFAPLLPVAVSVVWCFAVKVPTIHPFLRYQLQTLPVSTPHCVSIPQVYFRSYVPNNSNISHDTVTPLPHKHLTPASRPCHHLRWATVTPSLPISDQLDLELNSCFPAIATAWIVSYDLLDLRSHLYLHLSSLSVGELTISNVFHTSRSSQFPRFRPSKTSINYRSLCGRPVLTSD